MKRTLALLLAFVMCFSLCACGNDNSQENITENEELTAREKLTEKEEALFSALISFVAEDFNAPSEVRLLEVGDYEENSTGDSENSDWADFVVVRLQGQNKLGGTLNNHYLVCVNDTKCWNKADNKPMEFTTAWSDNWREKYEATGSKEHWEEMIGCLLVSMRSGGVIGDYAELLDYSITTDASDIFDVGKINKALAEYWEDMGL